MKKFIFTTITTLAAMVASACWLTMENFNGNYIAGCNNYYAHYTPVSSLQNAVYYNGGQVSLPLTVYVKVSPRINEQSGQNRIISATLQYKVKHNGVWGNWITVKSFTNVSWNMDYTKPVTLFGRNNINPRGLVVGDEIMLRMWLSDGVYETGNLEIDPGTVPTEGTKDNGGLYNGGWSAPFVFWVKFNGQYWR